MFGVFSNPKCLNMKSGNLFESARFTDSPTPLRTLVIMKGVAYPDGDRAGWGYVTFLVITLGSQQKPKAGLMLWRCPAAVDGG